MKISSYISLFDDWELLDAALKSIAPLVDEIVVVDGAYKWMAPFFGCIDRDVTRSVDAVRDVLSTYGEKVRVITGVWENELHKRKAGFEACRHRYIFRHDADEVMYFNMPALERFFRSGFGVAEMEMPTYAAPGWIIAPGHHQLPRQSFLFDGNLINADQHLTHLWLILSPEEARLRADRDRDQVFHEPVAFNAHLTAWRPPSSAVSRARFYVLNYIRTVGTLPWYPSFTYGPGSGFAELFSRIDPRAFLDILRGDPIVSGLPNLDNGVMRASPLSADQEAVLLPLWANFLHELTMQNASLATRPRAVARGQQHYMDVSTPESVSALEQAGRVCLRFSDELSACQVQIVSLTVAAPHLTSHDLDLDVSGREVSFIVPPLPEGSDRPPRRAIRVSPWGVQGSPILHFQLAPDRRIAERFGVADGFESAEASQPTPAHFGFLNVDLPDVASEARTPPVSTAEVIEGILRQGEALRQEGRFDEADAFLSDAIARFPGNPWIAIQHAWVATGRQYWAQAVRRWRGVVSRFPRNASAMVGLGEALREYGQHDEADAVLTDAMIQFPADEMPFIHHAMVAVRRGEWGQVLERWRDTRERFPDNVHARDGVLDAARRLGVMSEENNSTGAARLPNIRSGSGVAMRSPDTTSNLAVEFWRGQIRERYSAIRDIQACKLLPIQKLLSDAGYKDIEGSLISADQIDTPGRDPRTYLEKRLNYVFMFNQIRPWTVLEIGFNWGYSASLILESHTGCTLKSIDIAHHWYTKAAGETMKNIYSNRLSLVWEDSQVALQAEREAGHKYDAIVVDGGHTYQTARSDICLSIELLQPGGLLIIDDTDNPTVRGAALATAAQDPRMTELTAANFGCFEFENTDVACYEQRYYVKRFAESAL